MDYQSANAKLHGRCILSRKLQNNTYLRRRDGGRIAVRLHATDVITFHPDNSITLNTGGWNTITTRQRINSYQPHSVWSKRGDLFIGVRGKTREPPCKTRLTVSDIESEKNWEVQEAKLKCFGVARFLAKTGTITEWDGEYLKLEVRLGYTLLSGLYLENAGLALLNAAKKLPIKDAIFPALQAGFTPIEALR